MPKLEYIASMIIMVSLIMTGFGLFQIGVLAPYGQVGDDLSYYSQINNMTNQTDAAVKQLEQATVSDNIFAIIPAVLGILKGMLSYSLMGTSMIQTGSQSLSSSGIAIPAAFTAGAITLFLIGLVMAILSAINKKDF